MSILHMVDGRRFCVRDPEQFTVFPGGMVPVATGQVIGLPEAGQITGITIGPEPPPAIGRLRALKRVEPFIHSCSTSPMAGGSA